MGHNLRAIIARPELLEGFARRHGGIVVALEQRFAMIPATEAVLDSIGFGEAVDGFSHCNAALVDALLDLSRGGAVAYIETGYSGGHGTQRARAFRDGALVIDAPEASHGAINDALAAVGVRPSANQDRFDSLGLARFRHMDDWDVVGDG